MHSDEKDGVKILACTVSKTILLYDARGLADRGGADEPKPAQSGTVEAWGSSPDHPIGGWYELKNGLRDCFGIDVQPLLEALGLAEFQHNPKNNR